MRVTVIRNDSVVGVDGIFRTVDLSTMLEGVRVMQWEGDAGHAEFDPELNLPNAVITDISVIQPFIDLWTAAAPPAPTSAEMITDAKLRIESDCAIDLAALGADSPAGETEARAYLADETASIPWLKGFSEARKINIPNLVAMIIRKADAVAAQQGALTGKRDNLIDEIDALGPNPTQEQLDAIQW